MQPVRFPVGPRKQAGIDIVRPFYKMSQDSLFAIAAVDYYAKWPKGNFDSQAIRVTINIFLLLIFSREEYEDITASDHGLQF